MPTKLPKECSNQGWCSKPVFVSTIPQPSGYSSVDTTCKLERRPVLTKFCDTFEPGGVHCSALHYCLSKKWRTLDDSTLRQFSLNLGTNWTGRPVELEDHLQDLQVLLLFGQKIETDSWNIDTYPQNDGLTRILRHLNPKCFLHTSAWPRTWNSLLCWYQRPSPWTNRQNQLQGCLHRCPEEIMTICLFTFFIFVFLPRHGQSLYSEVKEDDGG